MVKAAKLGVAVKNAVAELKAVADHITVSNDEHAIAKLIYDIEKGIFKI
jgi:hydroxymethylpyrimidine pyrophosphatase-like HAD family hydrolase